MLSSDTFSDASAAIAKLGELQFGSTNKVLLFSQPPIGLGGQILARLFGLKLALIFERTVVFPHLTNPPYGQVFAPLHRPFTAPPLAQVRKLIPSTRQDDDVVRLDFWEFWNDVQLKDFVHSYCPLATSDLKYPDKYFNGAILNFCKLTADKAAFVDQAAQRLQIKSDTLGLHVRRGDKTVETPYLPLSLFEDSIAQAVATRGWRNVFLNSDDEKIYGRLRLPTDTGLIYDHEEARYNNANHRFLMSNPLMAEEETKTAIKIIFLLGRCGAVVGQSNAHIATLATDMICFREHGGDYGQLLDGFSVLKQSPLIRIFYSCKKRGREAVKRVLPHLTVKSRDPGNN